MKIPDNVSLALNLLYEKGYNAFLVGGCVRDYLRGETPFDYDITTPSFPDETKAVFEGYPTFLQGKKHGTVGVIINGEKLEITTFRKDGDYLDHRHPESVSFSNRIEDDLSRRDFTVNAMAYSPNDVGLVDLFSGIKDLADKIIRCVGNPDKRFNEDALRILRALRFASTLGFDIEDETKKSIIKNKKLLENISAERIREEIEKLIVGSNAGRILKEYMEVFEVFFTFSNVNLFLDNMNRVKSENKLLLFFCSIGNSEAIKLLKFSKEKEAFLKDAMHMYFEDNMNTMYDVKKAVSSSSVTAVKASLDIKGDTALLSMLEKAILNRECMAKKDMEINGTDLISAGFEAGQRLGEVLDRLFDMLLNGEVDNTKEALLKKAKEI